MKTFLKHVAGSTLAALAFALVLTAAATAAAQDGYLPNSGEGSGQTGYLPDEPMETPPGLDSAAEPPPGPVQGGIALGGSVVVPTGGDLRLGSVREMRGSGNLSLGGLVAFVRRLELEANFQFGIGGLDSDPYRAAFGLSKRDELRALHFWVGLRARAYLVANGNVRPFVSGSIGGDRLSISQVSGNGEIECNQVGSRVNCREGTDRDWTLGYWGLSTGFGGGVNISSLPDPMQLRVEVEMVHNSYGRATSSFSANEELPSDRDVWAVATAIVLQVSDW